MSVRILCDENVPVATVEALEDRGITATHVTDRPGAGIDDVRVFYYPENDIDPHRLVRRVAAVLEMVRDVAALPERVFLTATYDEER